MTNGANLLRCKQEQVAEGPRECLVGAVASIKCDREYVGCSSR